MDLLSIIKEISECPSFSSYEDALFPVVNSLMSHARALEVVNIPKNNLLIKPKLIKNKPTIALSAHLDKINHYGDNPPKALPFQNNGNQICGQLDDSVGVGLCLFNILNNPSLENMNLIVLLSEMEESWGLRKHTHLLRDGGAGLSPQIGSKRISKHLLEIDLLPNLVITIDTTPLFQTAGGVALYTNFWEKRPCVINQKVVDMTMDIQRTITSLDSNVRLANNINDYITYGIELNIDPERPIPSIAVEPAIFPYHQVGECVFVDDIIRTNQLINKILEKYCDESTMAESKFH